MTGALYARWSPSRMRTGMNHDVQTEAGPLLQSIDEPTDPTLLMQGPDPRDSDGTDGDEGDGTDGTDGADSDGTDGEDEDGTDAADGVDGDGTDGTDSDGA